MAKLTLLILVFFSLSCVSRDPELRQRFRQGDGNHEDQTKAALEIEAIAEGFSLDRLVLEKAEVRSAEDYVKFAAEGGLWALIRETRQKKLVKYLNDKQKSYEAFMQGPVSYRGTPALIFVLLKDLMPELFSSENFANAVGLSFADTKTLLPVGMTFTSGGRDGVSAKEGHSDWGTFVTFSCAACHSQAHLNSKQQKFNYKPETSWVIGAPSRVFDINRYRNLIVQAVQSPKFSFEEFEKVLKTKDKQSIYGPGLQESALKDTALFLQRNHGEKLIEEFKTQVLKKATQIKQTLGHFSYQGDMRLLDSSPGKVEAFGLATLALLEGENLNADLKTLASKYLPQSPSVADMMSVWEQNRRQASQWDGSLKIKLLRNLGAELGVAADPGAVHLTNAQATTDFIAELPAPPYPFAVDMKKAAQGRKVYLKVCAQCHDHERFVDLTVVGTEPGRATGLTSAARLILIKGLRAACQGASPEICKASDDDVLVPRQERPGYQALPLSGLWARAPYLHNGSVPTVYHLLVPEERPLEFAIGADSFDQTALGFSWKLQVAQKLKIDTRILGYGSKGHHQREIFFGGHDFAKEDDLRDSLLEYLKTL